MTARLVQAENYRKRVLFPGSTGCQPVLFGSLPKSSSIISNEEFLRRFGVVDKLPTTTG